MFALADCNNFYDSCERVFRPELRNKPIVVLSNNDGCVVARSNEVKQLGIANGLPHWQIRDLIERHKIHVFSSNYQLYGDLSARVMNLLGQQCDEIEVYSIDEAFMRFEFYQQTEQWLEEEGMRIKKYVEQCTGIPISIGFAPTKTLSKLANHISKKVTGKGVHIICDPYSQEELMKSLAQIDEEGQLTDDVLDAVSGGTLGKIKIGSGPIIIEPIGMMPMPGDESLPGTF
jgi:DNA polymerase V